MKKYYDIKKVIKEKNLIPKVVSLLLSIVLWIYASQEKMNEITIKFPIIFNGLNANYIISDISTKIVTAKISGYQDGMKSINSRSIKFTVDLSTAEPGNYRTYPIEWHKIDSAANYVITLDPEDVEILIEEKIERKVQ